MGPQEAGIGRRLAAIFAADVAGYSRLMGHDEVGTLRALSAARATLGRFIAEYGGRLVNTVGDSALAEFASVVDAVQCAMAAQRKLAEEPALTAEGSRLQFRIAVHVGDVMPSGTDILVTASMSAPVCRSLRSPVASAYPVRPTNMSVRD